MKELSKKTDVLLWGSCLVWGILGTWLFAKLPFISRVTMMWLDLVVINGGFTIWIGRHVATHGKAWQLFIFPIVFLLSGYFFTPRYMWYFALIYLAISYLSWSMSKSKTK